MLKLNGIRGEARPLYGDIQAIDVPIEMDIEIGSKSARVLHLTPKIGIHSSTRGSIMTLARLQVIHTGLSLVGGV
jgi:hypothetical protein